GNLANVSSAIVPYEVTYNICLDYDPAKATGAAAAKLRLSLCDVNNVVVSASPAVILTATGVTPPAVLKSVGSANPGSVFNMTGPDYSYVLDVKGVPAGDYKLFFKVSGDAVTHEAPFKLK